MARKEIQSISLIRNADGYTFGIDLMNCLNELTRQGLDYDVYYSPVVLEDEVKYVLYTAIVIPKEVNHETEK